MKRGHGLLVLGVVLLATANAARWWFMDRGAARTEVARTVPGAFQAENFHLEMVAPSSEAEAKPYRDPFQPKFASLLPVQKSITKAPPPLLKTPEQLAEEAARAELAQIKLMGVVFRGDQGQAYLVKGEQTYMVFAGETIGERFRVETIHPDSVQLLDPATQVSGQILVSGK